AVVCSTAIWNDTVVDLENRLEWFKARKARGFPVIVAAMSGKVAGYASYGDWRAFEITALQHQVLLGAILPVELRRGHAAAIGGPGDN
ncbi:N-acetyltransferase family protein, partial [Rhizobium ruizarguesonis]